MSGCYLLGTKTGNLVLHRQPPLMLASSSRGQWNGVWHTPATNLAPKTGMEMELSRETWHLGFSRAWLEPSGCLPAWKLGGTQLPLRILAKPNTLICWTLCVLCRKMYKLCNPLMMLVFLFSVHKFTAKIKFWKVVPKAIDMLSVIIPW